jgi:hypothetical protein
MFDTFPDLRAVIIEIPDLFPVEMIDAGVWEIEDETGNPILDTDNRRVLDESYA